MNKDLDKFLKDMDPPLPVDARAFLKNHKAIRRATINVPDGFLTPDDISFTFHIDAGKISFPYSHRLNGELLRLGVKMDTSTNEAVRMGKLLLDNLRLPDTQFGKHYTDAVLWPIIDKRFGKIDLIRKTLDRLSHYDPDASRSFAECKKYLQDQITGIGNSIVVELRYKEPSAFAILTGAVYYMLDQRHHISARRVLFPK